MKTQTLTKDSNSIDTQSVNMIAEQKTMENAQKMYYPTPESPGTWNLGRGFDPIIGTITNSNGFTADENSINETKMAYEQTKYGEVYDNTSFQTAMDYQEEAHGGGWGAKTSESVSASFNTKMDMCSFSLYGYGVKYSKSQNSIINSGNGQKLNTEARDYLKDNGYTEFCNKYGSYFISEVIYGTACKLHYYYKFFHASEQAEFHEAYSESVSVVGLSEGSSEAMNASESASTVNITVDSDTECIGFSTSKFITEADDIKVIMTEFLKDAEKPIAIAALKVGVLPWHELQDVQDVLNEMGDADAKSSRLTYNQKLGTSYNRIVNCINTLSYLKTDPQLSFGNFPKSAKDSINLMYNTLKVAEQTFQDLMLGAVNGEAIDDAFIDYWYDASLVYSTAVNDKASFTDYYQITAREGHISNPCAYPSSDLNNVLQGVSDQNKTNQLWQFIPVKINEKTKLVKIITQIVDNGDNDLAMCPRDKNNEDDKDYLQCAKYENKVSQIWECDSVFSEPYPFLLRYYESAKGYALFARPQYDQFIGSEYTAAYGNFMMKLEYIKSVHSYEWPVAI